MKHTGLWAQKMDRRDRGHVVPVSGTVESSVEAAELIAIAERFSAAGADDRREAFRTLLSSLKTAKDAGWMEGLAAALRLALNPMLDYTSAQSLNRFYKLLPALVRGRSKLRLAMLGGFTTRQLRDLIELYLFAANISAEIYEADYGVFRQEIFDPSSGLYRFEPDTIFLATNWRNLGSTPALSHTPQEVRDLLDKEYGDWSLLWQTAHDRSGSQILQNNFDTPPWRALGNHEGRHAAAMTRFISDFNRRLAVRVPSYVTIHDVDALAANIGRRAWGDDACTAPCTATGLQTGEGAGNTATSLARRRSSVG